MTCLHAVIPTCLALRPELCWPGCSVPKAGPPLTSAPLCCPCALQAVAAATPLAARQGAAVQAMAQAVATAINHIAPAELLPGDVWAVAQESSADAQADFEQAHARQLFAAGWRNAGLQG